jgi:ketosteroid isomerase-like protein
MPVSVRSHQGDSCHGIASASRTHPGRRLRRATYVFRRGADDGWLCAIDNSYGTALLDF